MCYDQVIKNSYKVIQIMPFVKFCIHIIDSQSSKVSIILYKYYTILYYLYYVDWFYVMCRFVYYIHYSKFNI